MVSRKAASLPILAWDGEGWDYSGRHVYGYLANSEGHELYKIEGLSTIACLDLIRRTGQGKLNVIFSGTYDCTLILKDLTPEQARECMETNKETNLVKGTKYGDYTIKYIPRKTLYIKHKNDKKGITLWDVFGNYQSSFVEALEKWFGKDYCELNIIHEGKKKRVNFDYNDIEFIRRYNNAELRALVALQEAFLLAIKDAGLKLRRFDGAGAVANAMFMANDIKKRVFWNDKQKKRLPLDMRVPSAIAYFGGRIEAFQYGITEKTIYHYDINSAYPSALVELPNFKEGEWSHILNPKFEECNKITLFKISWDVGDERICPFPYRSKLQKKILYPQRGVGWVWYPEVAAALQFRKPKWKLNITEAWTFTPNGKDDRPFEFIRTYYELRKKLNEETKKTGKPNGVEKILKLGLNSLYGKTAQRVGARIYSNSAYAGYITSMTRSKLYAASQQAPEDIISFATDGIFSTAPLNLPCPKEKELGLWEFETHTGMTLVQSGHYILNNNGKLKLWSRGFDKVGGEGNTVAERETDYQNKVSEYQRTLKRAWEQGKEQIYLPCTRFCGLKSASIGERWHLLGQWITMKTDSVEGKQLKIEPIDMKRVKDNSVKQELPSISMVKTLPLDNYTPDQCSTWNKDKELIEDENGEVIMDTLMEGE